MRRCAALPSAIVAAGLGCSPNVPSDLGERPGDQARVADAPALRHIAEALADGGERTVAELLADEDPSFTRAPDPSALLASMRAEHQALPPLEEGHEVRVLTLNAGFLDRWYPFTTVEVPHVDARRARLPELLFEGGWDALMLQEVWEHADVARFEAAGAARGYRVYGGSTKGHDQHGLVIAVREAILDRAAPEGFAEALYDQQYEVEDFPGPGVRRGYITWGFRHAPSGIDVRLLSTHIVSYSDRWFARDFQVRELGLAVRAAPEDAVVIVGGDFNAAPYYPQDTFGVVDGAPVRGWWRNTMMYPLFIHYGGVVDALAAVNVTGDVSLMLALPPYDAASWAASAYGSPSFCDRPKTTFSWDWCNSVAFPSGGETEYGARLDYLFLRDPRGQARVVESSMVYTERIDFGVDEPIEPADHYGFAATLQLGRR